MNETCKKERKCNKQEIQCFWCWMCNLHVIHWWEKIFFKNNIHPCFKLSVLSDCNSFPRFTQCSPGERIVYKWEKRFAMFKSRKRFKVRENELWILIVVNKIHIVNVVCWLKSRYMRVIQSKFTKNKPQFFSKPGARALDPESAFQVYYNSMIISVASRTFDTEISIDINIYNKSVISFYFSQMIGYDAITEIISSVYCLQSFRDDRRLDYILVILTVYL